jgi:pimeloyl-ACP methyl ester carboxylesterase
MNTHTLTLPHGTLTYDTHGEGGRAIVCIPGIGDTRASYRVLAPALGENDRVYVLDLRGHGDSSATFPSYTSSDIARDVVALLEAEDLHDAVLIGNSIGGGAACHAAVLAPERVGLVVLLNPFVRDMPADRWMRPMVPLMFAGLWGAWAWEQYRKTLFKTAPDDLTDDHARVRAMLQDPPRLAAMREMLRASKADIQARLAELAVPSLIIMGAEDPDYDDPAAEGQALRGLLGGPVEVALLDRTGHYPQIERPDETLRLVQGTLRQEARRGA